MSFTYFCVLNVVTAVTLGVMNVFLCASWSPTDLSYFLESYPHGTHPYLGLPKDSESMIRGAHIPYSIP